MNFVTKFKKKLNTFSRFKYKAIEQDKKDMANPERVEGSEDQWMCPFCKKKDFFELSQVWSHFDATDLCKSFSIKNAVPEQVFIR